MQKCIKHEATVNYDICNDACPLIKIIKESGETIILRRLDPMRVPIILTIILKLNVFYVFRQVGEVKKLELEIQTNRRQLDTFDRSAATAQCASAPPAYDRLALKIAK